MKTSRAASSSFTSTDSKPDKANNTNSETERVNRRIAKRSLGLYLLLGSSLLAFLLFSGVIPRANSFVDPPSLTVTAQEGCAIVKIKEVLCEPKGGYSVTFTITNTSGTYANQILVTPPAGSTFTLSPNGAINQPLANGASTTLTVNIGNAKPGDNACFFVTLMSKDGPCCTIRVCPELPQCCATAKVVTVECNQDGSYTYVFSIVNTGQNNVEYIYLYPPAGVTMTPNHFALVPALQPGDSFQTPPITITGAQPGSFSFGISLHGEGMRECCKGEQQVTLPRCGATAACAVGSCCARAPEYKGFTSTKVAAVTGQSANEVLTVFDISGANVFPPNVNSAPPKYNGPPSSPWTLQNLGTIFGVTFDHLGNIYVTASSAYNGDSYPAAGGAGRIYKIANGTGAISTFSTLPNTLDPAISTASEAYPALGNISFDCSRKQFFVTNEDDGRIYRLDSLGAVTSTFDHATGTIAAGGSVELGDNRGFAPLGERLWAVQVHDNRVYYSVWAEDCGSKNSDPNVKNSIWSVGIDVITGDFVASDKRLELNIPDLAGESFSNPTSDISFSKDGSMLLAERTMYSNKPGYSATSVNAHASRVQEYNCKIPTPTTPRWTLAPAFGSSLYKYNVGISASSACPVASAQPANAAGGIDYDYDASSVFGVWATGDALKFGPLIYGLQGFPITGGNVTNSALVDWIGLFQGNKTQIGDVEVTCPPGFTPYGRETGRLDDRHQTETKTRSPGNSK